MSATLPPPTGPADDRDARPAHPADAALDRPADAALDRPADAGPADASLDRPADAGPADPAGAALDRRPPLATTRAPLAAEVTTPAAYPAARPLRDAEANSAPSAYAGLVTRVLAVAVDAVVLNVVGWFTAVIVGLCLSVIDLPSGVVAVFAGVGAVVAVLWTVSYFVFFWSTTGQTPGNRLLRIRVVDARTLEAPSTRRAWLRFVCLPLSIIPLGAGVGMIAVTDRRRALHDLLARTLVLDTADSDDVPRRHQRS